MDTFVSTVFKSFLIIAGITIIIAKAVNNKTTFSGSIFLNKKTNVRMAKAEANSFTSGLASHILIFSIIAFNTANMNNEKIG